jgi:hypothetical protein
LAKQRDDRRDYNRLSYASGSGKYGTGTRDARGNTLVFGSSSLSVERSQCPRVRLHPFHTLQVPRHIVPPRRIFLLEPLHRFFRQDISMPPSRPEEGQMQARGEIVRVDEIPSGNAVEGIIVVEVGGVRGSGRGKVGKGYMADEMGKLRVGAPGSRGIRKGAESLTEMFDDVYQGETGGGRRQFEVAERRGRKDLHADTSAHGMSGDEKPFYPVSFLFRLPYHLRDLFENLFPHTQPHVQEERMHLPPIQVPSIGQAPLLLRILGVRPSVHLHLVRLGSFERQDHPPSDPKEYGLSPDR